MLQLAIFKRDVRGGSDYAHIMQRIAARLTEAGMALEEGPPAAAVVRCDPEAVGRILANLADNAAKYGALSVPEGRVAIGWELRRAASGETRFRMSWQEMGGPPVTPPEREGFGHTVMSQMVASSLRAQVALDYARECVSWTLDAPISIVTQMPAAPDVQPAAAAS